VSLEAGMVFGLQLFVLSQLPPAVLVQMTVAAGAWSIAARISEMSRKAGRGKRGLLMGKLQKGCIRVVDFLEKF